MSYKIPYENFWRERDAAIIGLSPMDGVTDPCFRLITARHGRPDLIVTEFTSVEAICRGVERELSGLIFDEIERPVIAQVYGADPATFLQVAPFICELGFDGIDINMGCPAKAVSSHGCGAGLIADPDRAKAIVRATQRGIHEWAHGAPLSILDRHPQIQAFLDQQRLKHPVKQERRPIPVSVKTRLGTNKIVILEWIQHLLEVEPAAICIHGRTLSQGYRGDANWEAIAEAASLARGTSTRILGNGDVKDLQDAQRRIQESGVSGVLIGRAALGNPWIFQNGPFSAIPPQQERWHVALEHARLFEERHGTAYFQAMRKHLGWYCRGFAGASRLRAQLMHVHSSQEVEMLFKSTLPESLPHEFAQRL